MPEFLTQPWPWYVAGPAIGIVVPALLLIGGKQFGVSENLRHLCAATFPGDVPFLKYDWKKAGLWNLVFVLGSVVGAFLASSVVSGPVTVDISAATRADLAALGIADFTGLAPTEIFSFSNLVSFKGLVFIVLGGFLVGFGARWAGGCTSGHAISGLADMQAPSLVAVLGFFAGGLIVTHLLYPLLF